MILFDHFLASVSDPFLKSGFNLAILHLLGNADSPTDRLHISVSIIYQIKNK